MSSSWTSVVRIGPAKTPPTQQLCRALVSYLGSLTEDEPLLQISNRYFKAKIRLETIGVKSDVSWKEDGIILVFMNDPPEQQGTTENSATVQSFRDTFQALNAVHEVATSEDAVAPAGDLLRLCVALSSEPLSESYKTTKQYELEYARRIHWCLDRGYEYVECDLLDLDKGHGDRDKEGFARIVEAIRGTVWSSAVMESKKTSALELSYQHEKLAVSATGTSVDACDDSYNGYEPPDPAMFSQSPVGEASLGPSTEDDVLREELARRELLSTCEAETPCLLEQQQREREEEHIFNTMENVLKQAADIREASRAGTLTHDERRKRAGDAAALLYQLMGDMGFDDSDDDEQESCVDGGLDDNKIPVNEEDAVASELT